MAEPLPPLAEPLPPDPRSRFQRAVRDACTYSADEGTCGWLLSEAQVRAVFAAGDELAAAMVQERAYSPEWQRGKR